MGSAGLVFGLARPALALTAPEARELVGRAVADINEVIASGKSEAAMIEDFKGIFERYADGPYLAAYALGNDRRGASQSQLGAFTDAFGDYIARKYGRRFREFIGGEIIVEESYPVKSYMEVRTTALLRGEAPFRVDFHVSDRPGRPVFFNIIIDGVNMLLSERTEIGAMLDRRRGDLDALIADLRTA
jgi:phospholipid transport system substrate-binding protein